MAHAHRVHMAYAHRMPQSWPQSLMAPITQSEGWVQSLASDLLDVHETVADTRGDATGLEQRRQ